MHKAEVDRLKDEIILKIVRNQEESQRGKGLNRENQTTIGTMGNQGIRRNIVGLERKNEGDKPEGIKEANVVSNKCEEDAFLLSLESVDDSWVLDFGASFHATPIY